MLRSYKLLDEEHLNEWTKNDDNIDNGYNGSADKRRRSIRTLRPNYYHQSKAGNQPIILVNLLNVHKKYYVVCEGKTTLMH